MCDSLNGFTWDLQRGFQAFTNTVRVFQVLIARAQPHNSIYFRSINPSPQPCGSSNSETISFPEKSSQMLVKDRRLYCYKEESLLLNVALELGPEGLTYSLLVKYTVLPSQSQAV